MSDTIQLPHALAKKYHLIRKLGEGANGVTWLAQTITNEKVAVKALRLAVSEDWKSFELFRREAETLASIHVEGVPKFYESVIAKDSGGECFLVQQYIEAPSLQQILKEKKVFTEQETLLFMKKTAQILKVLHTEYAPPIIHRDIKPSNILYAPDPLLKEPRIWLIDFGAVANPQSNNDGSTIAGTYGYMAPEQMLGKCTIASDYYALGATALQMLTGIEPFKLESDVFTLDYQKAIQEYAPQTSAYMQQLLSILLSPKEEDRPANAHQLLIMIQSVINGVSPTDRLKEKKQKSWIAKLLTQLFPSKPSNNEDQWIRVPGLIRCQKSQYIEYTFYTKDGEFLCGAAKNSDVIRNKVQSSQPLPIPCEVLYDPGNPIYNKFVPIE